MRSMMKKTRGSAAADSFVNSARLIALKAAKCSLRDFVCRYLNQQKIEINEKNPAKAASSEIHRTASDAIGKPA